MILLAGVHAGQSDTHRLRCAASRGSAGHAASHALPVQFTATIAVNVLTRGWEPRCRAKPDATSINTSDPWRKPSLMNPWTVRHPPQRWQHLGAATISSLDYPKRIMARSATTARGPGRADAIAASAHHQRTSIVKSAAAGQFWRGAMWIAWWRCRQTGKPSGSTLAPKAACVAAGEK